MRLTAGSKSKRRRDVPVISHPCGGISTGTSRSRRLGRAAAFGLALALALVVVGPASAATWSATTLHDDEVSGPLFAASCPSTSFCVVGGSDNLVATSTNPAGGAGAWQVFHPGGRNEIEFEPPPGSKGVSYPGSQVRGISCPVTGLCVGVQLDGTVVSSTNPAGGAAAWQVTPLSGEDEPRIHITGISCPATGFCAAVAYGGKVLSSQAPTGDAAAWQVTQLDSALDFRGVSCPTTSFCAAVDNEGSIVVSTDPGGPPSAWQVVGRPGGTGSLNGISCPTTSLCVTGNAGQMISSTSPTGGLGAWHAVSAGTGLPVKGVSCPTTSACAAVDNNADALVSTDPTSAAWDFTNVIPAPLAAEGAGQNGMFAISCAGTELCLAAGASEQIITSADPFAAEPVSAKPTKRGRLRVVITRHPAKRVRPARHGTRVAFRFHATGGRAARYMCKLSGRGVHRLGRRAPRGGRPGESASHRGGRRAQATSARPSTSAARLRHRHRRHTHKAHFTPCASPARYRVAGGTHSFRVRAIAPGGAKSPITTYHFRVGHLTERQPVGSCPATTSDQPPPGFNPHPCINGA